MTPAIASLTMVAVVNRLVPDAACLERHAGVLAGCVTDFDLVLVANGVDEAASLALKALVATVPDTLAVFLAGPVHDDVARLVGCEHAISDYVVFCDPLLDDPALLPALLAPLREGYDLAIADRGPEGRERSLSARILAPVYGALYRRFAGVPLSLQPTGLRVLSRTTALYVSGRPDAELLLRARSIGPGFPATTVTLPPRPLPAPPGIGYSWSKGIGLLLSISTMPLRGASYAALAAGGLSVLYSVYVFGIYLFKRDVAAGWTTMSLQLAAMMFFFSIVLLFLSEYVIQIHSASPPRNRRYLVVRELRSPLSRRTRRLNVVDGEGRFQLGKPAPALADSDSQEV
jgi:hypothetical protein